jgi:hypothetical protein
MRRSVAPNVYSSAEKSEHGYIQRYTKNLTISLKNNSSGFLDKIKTQYVAETFKLKLFSAEKSEHG